MDFIGLKNKYRQSVNDHQIDCFEPRFLDTSKEKTWWSIQDTIYHPTPYEAFMSDLIFRMKPNIMQKRPQFQLCNAPI